MNTIEHRFARDIAAVTGGVVVTESDLREAREAVDERIRSKRLRDRAGVAVAAAAAVAVAAVGARAFVTRNDDEAAQLAGSRAEAPDPDADHLTGARPTVELVEGVWRLDDGETAVRFEGNGTVRFDDLGTLFSRPATTGTFAITGDRIIVTTTADEQAGCAGTEFAMRASLPERGAMRFVVAETPGSCAPLPSGRGVLEQVLPTSTGMAELAFSQEPGWRPLADKAVLYGVWMAEGGGHLLEIEPGGNYVVADGSGQPADVGQWSLRGADLTLTSSTGSAKCSQGDRLVLAGVESIDPGTAVFRGTVRQNACGAPWTPDAWILIPNARE